MSSHSKVALVTAAGSGIGQASAVAIAKKGASVVVSDIDDDKGAATVRTIKETGGEATFIHADMAAEDDIKNLIAATVSTYGGLDWAHNNVGLGGPFTAVEDVTKGDWLQILGVNVVGNALAIKYELPALRQRGGGRIVNTASTFGLIAVKNFATYVVSKHAIIGLTRSVALDYVAEGIRINAIAPGATRTPALTGMFSEVNPDHPELIEQAYAGLHPINRLAEPSEIGETVAWLLADAPDYMTGHVLAVDGGLLAQ